MAAVDETWGAFHVHESTTDEGGWKGRATIEGLGIPHKFLAIDSAPVLTLAYQPRPSLLQPDFEKIFRKS